MAVPSDLSPSSPNNSEAPRQIGEVVAGLLDALARDSLIFLARDEARAADIARGLSAGDPEALVLFCPGSDALPGDAAPPTPANVGQRTGALRKLRNALQSKSPPRIALISTGEAAARLVPPPASFKAAPPRVQVGDRVDLAAFAGELEALGYIPDNRVDEPGELALRGQVLDVFPADAGGPFRIEVQDDRIIAIKPYDPVTQLSTGECDVLELGRVAEPEMGEGVPLPDHLPKAPLALDAGAEQRRLRFLKLAADVARRRGRDLLPDICQEERWTGALAGHAQFDVMKAVAGPSPRFVEQRNPQRAFAAAAREALDAGVKLVLLGTARDLRFLARRAAKLLRREAVAVDSWAAVTDADAGSVLLLQMPLPGGFRTKEVLAIAAADLLGGRAERDDVGVIAADADLFRLGDIKVGDVVIHQDHGLAVVTGLEALPDAGDAIVLRFAGGARRLVPAAEADRIWRYGGDDGAVTLDKLDGSTWSRRRETVEAAIAETAGQLARLAAERGERTAPVLEPDAAAYERFAAGFAYTETPDQARAIAAVRDDLASGRPMDRLVIGDVGYGKTEVALRAAALAALAGHQVALAAPTTVLARQHLETFSERFEDSGIAVAGLSRLSTRAEKQRVKAGLKDGSIRIVIGTGAVAGKGISYQDLALVIVDEEQKFGAADKQKLRDLGAGHLLTLSATPIPRTLQTALIGLQQMSVIATPPARRQPIRTTVTAFDDQLVRTALMRERARRGQSFVVVPRVEDMSTLQERLARLVPELKVVQAHGKMPGAEIDDAMVAFARGEGDVLLATNIIESGLDVPRANTMLVCRADRFGLSQLHQLRGRVGRGARRGQVWLLTEAGQEIAPRTLARLRTLEALDRLGAGFAISARDLDMRGAGDLLGEEQAGHVKLIGIDLYQHLLAQAVRKLRGETVDDWVPVISLNSQGSFPEDWVPEEDLRIGLYARLARITAADELDGFEEELADRFGELPEAAAMLLAQHRLQLVARSLGVTKLEAGPAAIALTLHPDAALDPAGAGLLEKNGRWLLTGEFPTDQARHRGTEELLNRLAETGDD